MPHAHASGFPSPCNDREGQALALRGLKRSRGTGPRATVTETLAGDRPPRYGNRDARYAENGTIEQICNFNTSATPICANS